MRYRRKIIGILTVFLTVLLLGVLLLCADDRSAELEKPQVGLVFSVQKNENLEIISAWRDPEGAYFVFLPGYAEMDNVFLAEVPGTVEISDVMMENGMSCGIWGLNIAYPMTSSKDGYTEDSTLTFIRSGGIPSLYIDVESGNMDYIHMEKGNKESGTMRLYDAEGNSLYSGILESMKGRGNTSWYADKKPYSLTLQQEADLLGMGTAQRWILLAEGGNFLNIRNKIVYDFAQRAGLPFSPQGEWVDLYLNREYTGVYLLSERNEVHPNRIDIAGEGSFVISMDHQVDMDKQNLPYVKLDSTQVLRIRDSSMSDQELYRIWRTFHDALLSDDGRDPITGKYWLDLIDLDSWVRKYLVEEVFANPDGNAVSQYFYLDGEDLQQKIVAGPVWDYDYSMGGEGWWMRDYPSFFTMAGEYTDDGMYLPWYYELYQKNEFYTRLKEIYEAEIRPLIQDLIKNRLGDYGARIYSASVTDGIRWGYEQSDIREELEQIGAILKHHEVFLTDMWITGTQYHVVRVRPDKSSSGYFAVKDGESLPDLPEANGLGWYNAETDEPFDITQPIYEDVSIYVKKPETSLPRIHYIPVFGMLLFMTGLVGVNCYRDKKNRSQSYDTTKAG